MTRDSYYGPEADFEEGDLIKAQPLKHPHFYLSEMTTKSYLSCYKSQYSTIRIDIYQIGCMRC